MPPVDNEEYYEDEEYEEEYEDEEEEYEDDGAAVAGAGSPVLGAGQQQPEDDEMLTDDDVDDEDEDEEEETDEEDNTVAQDWTGLRTLPEAPAVLDALRALRAAGRRQLSILLLGKGGSGKSSTVNSLLGERSAPVSAFKLQPDTDTCVTYLRQVAIGDGDLDGFRLRVIDTCGLEDPEAGDTVNYGALQRIAEDVKGVPIDVVMYVDRLDLYRVEPLDQRIIQCISETFGRRVWRHTVLALTHGSLPMPPPGTTFESFSERRVDLLRRAVRSLLFKPELPAVLLENGEGCKLDAQRRRLLPDGRPWVSDLWGAVAELAGTQEPYSWRRGLSRRPGSGRGKWLIPLLAYGQYLAWKVLLQPRLRADEDKLAAADEAAWAVKAAERKRLGIGPPLRPTPENAARLEQMYDDD